MKRQTAMNMIARSFSVLVLMTTVALAQDRITRTGEDKPVLGEIKSMTNEEISVETRRDGVVRVTPNEVVEIKWEAEPARFSAGRSFESKGYLPRAYEAYTEALKELEGGNPLIRADIEFHLLRLKAKMAMAGATLPDQQTADQLIEQFSTFLNQHKSDYVYYPGLMILGRLARQQEKPEALDYFAELQKTPWNDYKIWGYTAEGYQKLASGLTSEALETFEKALELPYTTQAEEQARAEATLGKVNTLVAQDKTDQAIPLLDELIEKAPGNAPETHARIYLTQGRIYQKLNRNNEAVVALLHVDLLYPQSAPEHAESLYHLSKLWAALGQPDRAATARARLTSDYPDSRWANEANSNN